MGLGNAIAIGAARTGLNGGLFARIVARFVRPTGAACSARSSRLLGRSIARRGLVRFECGGYDAHPGAPLTRPRDPCFFSTGGGGACSA